MKKPIGRSSGLNKCKIAFIQGFYTVDRPADGGITRRIQIGKNNYYALIKQCNVAAISDRGNGSVKEYSHLA
jgi:hypothetical protein